MRVGRLLWSNDISAEYSTADNPKFPKQMNEVGRPCWCVPPSWWAFVDGGYVRNNVVGPSPTAWIRMICTPYVCGARDRGREGFNQ